jgi:hypothetical protein
MTTDQVFVALQQALAEKKAQGETHIPIPIPMLESMINVVIDTPSQIQAMSLQRQQAQAMVSTAIDALQVYREALTRAREKFIEYEANHMAKTPPDFTKAGTNKAMAEYMAAALNYIPPGLKVRPQGAVATPVLPKSKDLPDNPPGGILYTEDGVLKVTPYRDENGYIVTPPAAPSDDSFSSIWEGSDGE